MTTLEAYQMYLALRLHFSNPKYDITKTKGRVRISPNQLDNKPRLKQALDKMSVRFPRKKFIDFMVASFIRGENPIFSPRAEENYVEYVRFHESAVYLYKRDLSHLSNHVDTLADAWQSSGNHPVLLKEHLGKRIHLETLIILDRLFNFVPMLNTTLAGDPVWMPLADTMYKYSPFIKVDRDKFTMLTQQVFS